MPYYLYILKSKSADKYYTGISANPFPHHEYHNFLKKGLTSRYRPWEAVLTKEFDTKKEAALAEKKIKSWKRKAMIEIIL